MDPYYHQFMEGGGSSTTEREHMFEKPLTPSDVGKLNRLVIPKQHAERHFPLAGHAGEEKGLLLSFEDESGKSWRFRYSYWTSSQSYVLTKGWSRFVKEKQLDAGDIVLFERTPGGDRLYISCRRRCGGSLHDSAAAHGTAAANAALLPWSPAFYTAATAHPLSPSASYLCYNSMQQDCHLHLHAGEHTSGTVVESAVAPANSKRLRLFGVNLECGPDLL